LRKEKSGINGKLESMESLLILRREAEVYFEY
jgi:hypothetical protein